MAGVSLAQIYLSNLLSGILLANFKILFNHRHIWKHINFQIFVRLLLEVQ